MIDLNKLNLSDKELDKLVSKEMEPFDLIEKQYPSLSKFRKTCYTQFKKHYQLFQGLVVNSPEGNIYLSTLITNGIILRSLNFYRGALWALGSRNPHIFYDSLRSQCETLALVYYCFLNPSYIEAATIGKRKHKEESLKIENVLNMIDKLDKKYNGIRKDYDALCELVHPNPHSLYLNVEPKEGEGRNIIISTVSTRIDDKEATKDMLLFVAWTTWLFVELVEFNKKVVYPFSKEN